MRKKALPLYQVVALIVSLSLLSCGGGSSGGGTGPNVPAVTNDEAFAVAIQPLDGKLVTAGASSNSKGSRYQFALVRYNTDGSLDTTFNKKGIVTTTIGDFDDEAFALAIQPDGKLVAAGYSYNGTQYGFALVRYNTDGSLDTTFNTTGIVTTAIGTTNDVAYGVAIQSDGKMVVAGRSFNGTAFEFALVRYNADGSLDTSFNTTGIVTTAIGAFDDEAFALAVQPDGKLVAAGHSNTGSLVNPVNVFALVRYNSDGSLDMTFHTTGIVTTAIGAFDDEAFALAIQPDGKLVAAGYSNTGSLANPVNVFALVRYNSDGSLDTTFHTTGIVTTAIGAFDDEANALAIQSDGKLVAAGISFDDTLLQYKFALVRYNTDGSLDTTFHTTGIVTTAINH